MGIITKMLKQKAVYWEFQSLDSFGKPVFSTPKEISVRWEDTLEKFMDASGNEVVSKSKVYCDRDLKVRSLLKLSKLEDLPSTDWQQNSGVFTISRFDKIPNLRNTETVRIAYL